MRPSVGGPKTISQEEVYKALSGVIDPELGINIVDLGLVYSVEAQDGRVRVAMTVTTPACPLSAHLKEAAEATIWRHVKGAQAVEVELVWEPPWNPAMMSQEARGQLS